MRTPTDGNSKTERQTRALKHQKDAWEIYLTEMGTNGTFTKRGTVNKCQQPSQREKRGHIKYQNKQWVQETENVEPVTPSKYKDRRDEPNQKGIFHAINKAKSSEE